tara:strand:- start:4961 stop:5188 length:228 start_codon:yes stop_codon:yes gene_type:complete
MSDAARLNMSNIMYECKSCLRFYDGAAQCCPDMHHVAFWVDELGQRTRQVNWDVDFERLGEDFCYWTASGDGEGA